MYYFLQLYNEEIIDLMTADRSRQINRSRQTALVRLIRKQRKMKFTWLEQKPPKLIRQPIFWTLFGMVHEIVNLQLQA